MKKIIVLCILFLCATGVCLAQTNKTRSMSVTTYYPSPTAVYSNLRLSPTNASFGNTTGVLYYNYAKDKIVYNNKTNGTIELPGSGGGGPDYWVYNVTAREALNNTNSTGGTVHIGEFSPGGEALEVNGDVVSNADTAKGYTGSSRLDLWRNTAANKAELVYDTYPSSADEFRLWLQGDPGILTLDDGNDATIPFMTVNNMGKVGIGVNVGNSSCNLTVGGFKGGANISQSLMMIEGDGAQSIYMMTGSDTASYGPEIRAYRSRGSLGSEQTAVKKNDTLLKMQGWGWNGAAFVRGGFFELSADGDFSSTSSPGKISFWTTPTGSTVPHERMVITSSGNVGINETDPQNKLFVRIDASKWGFVNSTTGRWTFASDRRLKKNISVIEDALEKVMRVQGVRYDPIDEPSSPQREGKVFGFIAQDLEPILPELVSTDRKGRKSVAYSSISPVLVEAIKAQHNEIESLRKEIKALRELR